MNRTGRLGLAGTIAQAFIGSTLTPLLVIGSVLLGVLAIVVLPREEEPQIKVPVVDLLVALPGSSAAEVERRVSSPVERLLWEIPGVEYVYSTSQPGQSLIVVRFRVGDDPERSLVKLHQKLEASADRMLAGASTPLIKVRSIDDVPILALTFHAQRYDHLALRRLAAQVDAEIQARARRLADDPHRWLPAAGSDPARPAGARGARAGSPRCAPGARPGQPAGGITGAVTADDRDVIVQTGGFFTSADDVAALMVGVQGGHPVYLRDVARVEDGAEEPTQYVLFGTGAAVSPLATEEPAVTLSVAKRPGSNAITVARAVLAQVDRLKGKAIPGDVSVSITRHYGASAAEKSNELLLHMAIAVVGVSLLVLFMLGWREAIVVAIAIPSHAFVDAPALPPAGIHAQSRHALRADLLHRDPRRRRDRRRGEHRPAPESRRDAAPLAPGDRRAGGGRGGNPTVLATLTVIAAILPMAFVGGLNGPYLRPIPVGASAAMVFSLLVAFAVTPWAAARLLGLRDSGDGQPPGPENPVTRAYRWLMSRLVGRPIWRWSFLGLTVVLFLGAVAFVPTGWVRVKMLPYDNKSELEIVLNMPEESSLERTAQVAGDRRRDSRTERGHRLSGLCRDGGPLQLQRTDAALRPAPGLERGGGSGEPALQGEAHRAEPRVRAPHKAHRRGHRRPVRCARGGCRGAARATRSAGARRRGVRTGRGDAPAPGRIDAKALHQHPRRGRRRLVRRSSTTKVAPVEDRVEGRARWHRGRTVPDFRVALGGESVRQRRTRRVNR